MKSACGKVSKISVCRSRKKCVGEKKKKKHAQNIRSTVHRTGDLTRSSAIAESNARRSVSVEMLFDCGTYNNANRSSVSVSSTFNTCRARFIPIPA